MKDFKLSVVSIHQPQYLPWFFYFQKILESDFFVFLDNAQFQKNGIQNRNKIKNKDGELWLTVPVKRSLDTKINEVEIDNTKNWKKKHLKTIEESYSKSKFYNYYKKEFEELNAAKTIYHDPTVYVNITSKKNSSDAPENCENWFVMINVPSNENQDWDELIIKPKHQL